jgi:hypothetical protein
MNVKVALSQDEIKTAIANYVQSRTGVAIDASSVSVQVKSTQNYRAEWENAAFRAEFEASERSF